MWNPRAILDIYPEQNSFHCVGTTLSGLRCRNSFISRQYLAEAVAILDSLPEPRHSRTNNARLLSTLQCLAFLTLCPRWHQTPGRRCQVDIVASGWLRKILDTGDQRQPRPIRSDSYSTSSYLPSPPPTPSSNSQPSRVERRSAAPTPESLDRAHGRRQPSPSSTAPSSPTRSQPSITPRTPQSSRGRDTPTPSSSHGTANSTTQHSRREAPINININITVNGNQSGLHRSPSSASFSSSRTNRLRPASPPPITPSRTPSINSHISATINDRPATSDAIEEILERLMTIESLLRQTPPRASSRSSRSSSRLLSSGPNAPSSPALSAISNLSMPPLLEPPSFFFPAPRSPAPSPPSGPLSISSDSSSREMMATPSSSGMSSPVLLSPRSASPPAPVRSNGGSSSSRRVRRRPITADTTCYVCYQSIADADDAFWCRGRCGQNVCVDCFDEWTFSQLEGERDVLCGFCRAPWVF